MFRFARCIAAPIIGASVVFGAPAAGQTTPESTIKQVQPAWMAVDAEIAPMRSGDLDRFYAIAEFKRGQLLRVDGKSGDWARVRYPQPLHAFVKASEANAIDDTTIELTAESKLRASSLLYGLRGSWKSLYSTALPAGTILTVVGEERDSEGRIVGYKVTPPAPPAITQYAHGFIRTDALRAATPAEVEAHLAKLAKAGADPESEADLATANASNAAEPEAVAADTTKAADAIDTSLIDPIVENLGEGVQVASVNDLPKLPALEPEVIDQSTPADDAVVPEAAAWDDLEATFQAARALPRTELDEALSELLAEYKRAHEASTEPVITEAIAQRIEWFELRIETRDSRRKLLAALAEADELIDAQNTRIDAWHKARGYQIVGRLVRSSVYDGKRLPLMYRVQAISASGPRTIGYIRPSADDDLSPKLGSIVGIRGEQQIDPVLGLAIILPSVIDVMTDD